jgi:hypothetical protein
MEFPRRQQDARLPEAETEPKVSSEPQRRSEPEPLDLELLKQVGGGDGNAPHGGW